MLSYLELVEIVERGVIAPVDQASINASSIDVHLGEKIIIEKMDGDLVVDPLKRTNFASREYNLAISGPYLLRPGEFVLAHTVEVFNLPMDISAEFRLKSSGARSGLNNLFACHCDPGWHGSTLTLELSNVLLHHGIQLTAGMPIGQMLFHRHHPVPADRSYAALGRYNGDKSVSGVKK